MWLDKYEVYRLIHLFNKYFASTYHGYGIVLVAGIITMNKTVKNFKELTF